MSVEQVRVQLFLRDTWAYDENRTLISNLGRNRFEKGEIDGDVTAVARVRLVVEMGVGMGTVYDRQVSRSGIEAENPG